MVLVEYSDSDSDRDEEVIAEPDLTTAHPEETLTIIGNPANERKRKASEHQYVVERKKAPPLPPSFHSLYATTVRTSINDDPALHGGRQRQIPHIEGNWPSHIFLEWLPNEEDLAKLEKIVREMQQQDIPADVATQRRIHSFMRSDLGVRLPLHVSLSAPLILTTAAKDRFLSTMKNALREADISKFKANGTNVDWVSNFDKSRYFLVLRLKQSPAAATTEPQLNRLLRTCNDVCHSFGLPLLYEKEATVGVGVDRNKKPKVLPNSQPQRHKSNVSDAFHVSIAWSLDEPLEQRTKRLESNEWNLDVEFTDVKIKIGNVVTEVPLKSAD